MADNVTGIVLDIPANVLQNIKNADKAIKDLEKTSRQAADNIKKDFGTIMVSGVEAFIRKVQEAQGRLNNLTMPSVGAKKLNLGDIGAGATKSASDISTLVQSLSQLTAALEKNKGVRAANKNVASQETEYARVSAELAKQAERYTQLSLAIEQFNQKKRDETSLKERQTNASNIQELQALQQTIPLLRQKVELMERNMRAAQTANNPTLQTRKAQEELAQMNKMYAEEEKASAKKAAQLEKDRQREAEAARKSYEQQQKMYEKLFGKGGLADKQIQQSLSQQKATTLASPTGAMDYAKNAKSLRDLQAAYKNLKAVMATVDPKTAAWQQMNTVLGQTRTRIDEIKKKMGEFKSHASQVGDVAGQLKRTLAAAFSISAITGYINKLIETRAQFELQQTALRAILQDKQKADQIFQQVQQMALQSPFSIMQMTTFTKQLAAYRIESEKLVGTTKMLADVSAGLGVDMGRLILAYGQVKAANYLRATEVRQFTEAGLNIAGELATYFSELQGKMISVGDVMEMITKRMVRFEDVEEVFKRVTSEGGLFYDMQKKQSETLWGQLQRIKDAMSIMFNEIGKGNEGAILSVVKGIRSLLQEWRTIAVWLKSIVISWGAYKSVVLLAQFAQSQFGRALMVTQLRLIQQRGQIMSNTTATVLYGNAIKTLRLALKGLAIATIPGLLITGLVVLINKLIQASEKAAALREEMERIGNESLTDLNDSIANFMRLTGVITDASKSYTEHKDALDELRRSYGDILPEQKLTMEYIQSLNGNYEELTATIIKYYQAQEYQKKYEAVLSSDYTKDLREELEESYKKANEQGNFEMIFPESQVKDWADTVANELATGKIPRSLDALKKRTQEIFGKDIEVGTIDFGDTIEDAETVAEKMGDISLSTIGAANAQEAFARSMKASREANEKMAESLTDSIAEQERLLRAAEASKTMATGSQKRQLQQEIEERNAALAKLKQQLDDVNAARAEMIAQDFKDEVEAETSKLTELVKTWWDNEQQMKSLEKQGKKNSEQYQQLEKTQTDVKNSADAMAKKFGTKVPWAMVESQRTSNDLGKVLDNIATSAFPAVAKAAIYAMKKAHESILVAKGGVLSFVNSIIKLLPDDWAEKLPDVAKMIADNDKELATLRGELSGVKVETKQTSESVADIYSRRAQVNVDKFGADMKAIDNVLKQGADTPREMAKTLRGSAKVWEETFEAYNKSTNKVDWLKMNNETEQSMALMEKNAKAAKALASEIWGEADKKSGGRQEDAELKRWQNIKKAIEDTAKSYEEYRNGFSKGAADKMIDEQFGKAFSALGVKISDYFKDGVFDTQALIDALKKLHGQLASTTSARAKALNDLLLEIESKGIELKVKLAENAEKDLKSQIDEMFANYELSKTLGNLGLNIDLTYLVGGKPMTLDDIKKKLAEMRAADDGSEGAKNRIKIYEEAEKKITDLENKNAVERLKKYSKYLATSYSDAAKLQLEYYSNLTQMRESFAKAQADLEKKLASPDVSLKEKLKIQQQLDNLPEQSKRAAQGMREEMEKELSKLNMDALFKSTLFSEMFQDLGNLSGKVLDKMLDKIKEIQNGANNLSLSQVRQLAQAAEKIDNAKIDTASFKEAASYITKAYKLVRKGISPEKANTGLADASALLDVLNQQIVDYNLIIGIKEKGYKIDGQNLVVAGERVSLTDQQRQLLSKSNQALNTQLDDLLQSKGAAEELVAKFREYVQTFNKGQKATQRMNTLLQKLGEAGKAGIDAIVSGVEMFGGSVDDSTQMWLDFVGQIIDSCISLGIMFVALGIEINSLLGIIGIIAAALTVVAGLFKTILGASDARKEKQIKKLKDRVDELKNAYEDLGEAIDNAYKFSDYKLGYQQSLANIKQQEAAYREMIRLEESKKKTDQDKIKDYRDALRDLEKARKQLQDDMYEDWGSVGESGIRTEAENFVSAWLDAYKEVGDGLDALNEHWDDFLKNLVLKQAASAVVGARIKKYIEQLNKAIENGEGGLSLAQTFAQIGQNLKSELGTWNEDLKAFFDAVGIKGGQGELLLSDLQKGIQNITEPQAAAIEAYLNSMRFAVFEQNNILTEMLSAIQAQYGSNDNSPMLQEVRAIRSLVASIDDRLSRVIVQRSSVNTGYAVVVK